MARRNKNSLTVSFRWLCRVDVPRALFPPTLLRLVLVVLRFVVRPLCANLGRVLGATITSASGDILAKGTEDASGGESEFTIMLAVEVGER